MTRIWERPVRWWREIGSTRTRVVLLVILIAGGALRVAWVSHAGVQPQFNSDPKAYLFEGEALAKGQGFTNPLIGIENAIRKERHEPPLPPAPFAFYPPGYPVFVGAVVWAVRHTPIPDGDEVRTIEYVQALLGVLTILMGFALARRVFDTRTGLVAAALLAVFPNLVTTTATLQLETVFVALSLATLLLLLSAATGDDLRIRRLVASGAFMGLVALVRPTVALLIVAFVAARFVARRAVRETVLATTVIVVAMVAVMVPWTIRNAVVLHAFVPLSTGVGPTLCASRNPEATGGLDSGIVERQCVPKHLTGSVAQQDVATNSYGTHVAIHWVIHHPTGELRMWFWRTDIAFRGDSSGLDDFRSQMDPQWARFAISLSDDASFVVLGFAVIGVVLVVVRKRAAGVFLVASALAYAAVPIILFGDPRYRLPADPLFVILAAAGICAAIDGATGPPAAPHP